MRYKIGGPRSRKRDVRITGAGFTFGEDTKATSVNLLAHSIDDDNESDRISITFDVATDRAMLGSLAARLTLLCKLHGIAVE